eukprot:Platyproteum_vivax@DN14624_c0_g1_i1.p1
MLTRKKKIVCSTEAWSKTIVFLKNAILTLFLFKYVYLCHKKKIVGSIIPSRFYKQLFNSCDTLAQSCKKIVQQKKNRISEKTTEQEDYREERALVGFEGGYGETVEDWGRYSCEMNNHSKPTKV